MRTDLFCARSSAHAARPPPAHNCHAVSAGVACISTTAIPPCYRRGGCIEVLIRCVAERDPQEQTQIAPRRAPQSQTRRGRLPSEAKSPGLLAVDCAFRPAPRGRARGRNRCNPSRACGLCIAGRHSSAGAGALVAATAPASTSGGAPGRMALYADTAVRVPLRDTGQGAAAPGGGAQRLLFGDGSPERKTAARDSADGQSASGSSYGDFEDGDDSTSGPVTPTAAAGQEVAQFLQAAGRDADAPPPSAVAGAASVRQDVSMHELPLGAGKVRTRTRKAGKRRKRGPGTPRVFKLARAEAKAAREAPDAQAETERPGQLWVPGQAVTTSEQCAVLLSALLASRGTALKRARRLAKRVASIRPYSVRDAQSLAEEAAASLMQSLLRLRADTAVVVAATAAWRWLQAAEQHASGLASAAMAAAARPVDSLSGVRGRAASRGHRGTGTASASVSTSALPQAAAAAASGPDRRLRLPPVGPGRAPSRSGRSRSRARRAAAACAPPTSSLPAELSAGQGLPVAHWRGMDVLLRVTFDADDVASCPLLLSQLGASAEAVAGNPMMAPRPLAAAAAEAVAAAAAAAAATAAMAGPADGSRWEGQATASKRSVGHPSAYAAPSGANPGPSSPGQAWDPSSYLAPLPPRPDPASPADSRPASPRPSVSGSAAADCEARPGAPPHRPAAPMSVASAICVLLCRGGVPELRALGEQVTSSLATAGHVTPALVAELRRDHEDQEGDAVGRAAGHRHQQHQQHQQRELGGGRADSPDSASLDLSPQAASPSAPAATTGPTPAARAAGSTWDAAEVVIMHHAAVRTADVALTAALDPTGALPRAPQPAVTPLPASPSLPGVARASQPAPPLAPSPSSSSVAAAAAAGGRQAVPPHAEPAPTGAAPSQRSRQAAAPAGAAAGSRRLPPAAPASPSTAVLEGLLGRVTAEERTSARRAREERAARATTGWRRCEEAERCVLEAAPADAALLLATALFGLLRPSSLVQAGLLRPDREVAGTGPRPGPDPELVGAALRAAASSVAQPHGGGRAAGLSRGWVPSVSPGSVQQLPSALDHMPTAGGSGRGWRPGPVPEPAWDRGDGSQRPGRPLSSAAPAAALHQRSGSAASEGAARQHLERALPDVAAASAFRDGRAIPAGARASPGQSSSRDALFPRPGSSAVRASASRGRADRPSDQPRRLASGGTRQTRAARRPGPSAPGTHQPAAAEGHRGTSASQGKTQPSSLGQAGQAFGVRLQRAKAVYSAAARSAGPSSKASSAQRAKSSTKHAAARRARAQAHPEDASGRSPAAPAPAAVPGPANRQANAAVSRPGTSQAPATAPLALRPAADGPQGQRPSEPPSARDSPASRPAAPRTLNQRAPPSLEGAAPDEEAACPAPTEAPHRAQQRQCPPAAPVPAAHVPAAHVPAAPTPAAPAAAAPAAAPATDWHATPARHGETGADEDAAAGQRFTTAPTPPAAAPAPTRAEALRLAGPGTQTDSDQENGDDDYESEGFSPVPADSPGYQRAPPALQQGGDPTQSAEAQQQAPRAPPVSNARLASAEFARASSRVVGSMDAASASDESEYSTEF